MLPALILFLATGPCAANDAAQAAGLLVSADRADRAKGLASIEEQGQTLMPGLKAVLRSGKVEARRGAAIGLSLMPIPGLAVEPLVLGLGDDDAVVRGLCAHGLGKIGAPAAPRTAQLLTHSDNRVRVGAALALSKMGPACGSGPGRHARPSGPRRHGQGGLAARPPGTGRHGRRSRP